MGQYCETLVNRIGTGPLLTKPIRVRVSSGFQHGIECQQMQCLVTSIFHGGDSERPHRFAVRFQYVNPSERLRLIASALKCMYCPYLLFWSVPNFGTVSMLGVRAGRGRNLMVSGFGGYDHGVHRVG